MTSFCGTNLTRVNFEEKASDNQDKFLLPCSFVIFGDCTVSCQRSIETFVAKSAKKQLSKSLLIVQALALRKKLSLNNNPQRSARKRAAKRRDVAVVGQLSLSQNRSIDRTRRSNHTTYVLPRWEACKK